MEKLSNIEPMVIRRVYWSKGKCFVVYKDGKVEEVIDNINRKSY